MKLKRLLTLLKNRKLMKLEILVSINQVMKVENIKKNQVYSNFEKIFTPIIQET